MSSYSEKKNKTEQKQKKIKGKLIWEPAVLSEYNLAANVLFRNITTATELSAKLNIRDETKLFSLQASRESNSPLLLTQKLGLGIFSDRQRSQEKLEEKWRNEWFSGLSNAAA